MIVCAGVGLSLGAAAQTEEEKAHKQLQQLQLDMQRITREIGREKARKDSLQEQLRQTEVNLGKLQGKIRDNESARDRANQQLADLKVQRDALEDARDRQQESIAREMKGAYRLGRQGQVQVLLNQEEPDKVSRAMTYYRYFLAAREQQVGEYRETLAQLAIVEPQINSLSQQLAATGLALEKQRRNLRGAQAARESAVANLAASIQSKGGELKQMEGDRRELERLLEAIEEAIVNLQVPDDYRAFKAAKGNMPWPIAGKKPVNRYGKYRNEGKMRWQGVSISASEGTSVTAIHHGRVVYADWLRGSGLLLIIDHGEGYMSLYAHNQTLLKEVGEWVTAGTPVSTVGSSGGQDSAALYFEIRHNGKTTNPASWCKG